MGLWALAALLLLGLASLVFSMRRTSTGSRVVRWGRVTGVVGRKGHGKTLFAVHELLRTVGHPQACKKCSADEGRRVTHRQAVAFNGALTAPGLPVELVHNVTCWADLYKLPHSCFVVIDEIGMDGWAPSSGQILPAEATHMLAQCRKYGLEIMWIAQHEARVSSGLRQQTDEMGRCRRGFLGQMRVDFFEPENLRVVKQKPLWTFRYRVSARLGAAYDTFQFIESSDAKSVPVVAVTTKSVRPRSGLAAAPIPVSGVSTRQTVSATFVEKR